MTNQADSKDGIPRKDGDRPAPDVGYSTDGQSDKRGKGATDEQGERPQGEEYRGDGPSKVGLTSSAQPNLVAPSGVNQGDRGAADDPLAAGDTVNLDDDDQIRPRGKSTAAGGTWEAQGGDSGRLGAPSAGLSDRNGPSDPAQPGGERPGS